MQEKELLSVDVEFQYIVHTGRKISDKYFTCDIFAKPHFLFFVKTFKPDEPAELDRIREHCAKLVEVRSAHPDC